MKKFPSKAARTVTSVFGSAMAAAIAAAAATAAAPLSIILYFLQNNCRHSSSDYRHDCYIRHINTPFRNLLFSNLIGFWFIILFSH